MTKYKLEYIWLDGKKPIPELRGKTQIKSFDHPPTLSDLPNWGFDGSSTMQAEGHSSDCVLKPVALYPDASRKDGYVVMNEVYHADGTPHTSNARATTWRTRAGSPSCRYPIRASAPARSRSRTARRTHLSGGAA
jgi:glutamine synthetase